MKITKTLMIAAGLAIGGLNVSAQTMDPEQTAQKETAEIKSKVTGITANEESQILAIEKDHAISIRDAKSTVADKEAQKKQCKQLCESRDTKIKAILTADQYKQYLKVEKSEKKKV